MRNTLNVQSTQIGWREYISLPDLGLSKIKAKIDTGARTSALHAIDIEAMERNQEQWVSFRVPMMGSTTNRRQKAKVVDQRKIKNTSGRSELRFVVATLLVLGKRQWQIELSLADREQMGFDIILGRTAIRGRNILVDPGRSFLAGEPEVDTSISPQLRDSQVFNDPAGNQSQSDLYSLEEEE
jgi:hypothetical protein